MTDTVMLDKPETWLTGELVCPRKICFVCTGNTCRSPMAEAMFNHLAKKKRLRFSVSSAGLSAVNGDPISENAVKALKKAGVECTPENDYENHTAKMLDEQMANEADEIVAISSSHMMHLLLTYPQHAHKLSVFPIDIPDPFMYGEEEYEKCLTAITECLKEMYLL